MAIVDDRGTNKGKGIHIRSKEETGGDDGGRFSGGKAVIMETRSKRKGGSVDDGRVVYTQGT